MITNSRGQSLFELILFVPIMLYLIVTMINIGNSINTSINQQKAARGYLFYLMKGNSNGYKSGEILTAAEDNLEKVSAYIVGWRFKEINDSQSIGTYFKLPTVPFDKDDNEDCEEKTEDSSSSCIKVFTIFGVCGETYVKHGDNTLFKVDYPTASIALTSKNECVFK